jgi:hypothetical protein
MADPSVILKLNLDARGRGIIFAGYSLPDYNFNGAHECFAFREILYRFKLRGKI